MRVLRREWGRFCGGLIAPAALEVLKELVGFFSLVSSCDVECVIDLGEQRKT